MKQQIRRGVFETNSSSTHSISIYRYKKPQPCDIPHNSSLEVKGFQDDFSGFRKIRDQVGKLNYIASMLASILDCSEELEYGASFDIVIANKRFVWLKELIKEKCNTDIIYKCGVTYFPYFEPVYDENLDIEDIFDCDINNEEDLKRRMEEIIFDPDIIIEDKDEEY